MSEPQVVKCGHCKWREVFTRGPYSWIECGDCNKPLCETCIHRPCPETEEKSK